MGFTPGWEAMLSVLWSLLEHRPEFQKGWTLGDTKYTQPGTEHQEPSFLRAVSVEGKELEEFSVVTDLNKKRLLTVHHCWPNF